MIPLIQSSTDVFMENWMTIANFLTWVFVIGIPAILLYGFIGMGIKKLFGKN